MLEHEYLEEFGIHYIRAREPFDLEQVYRFLLNENGAIRPETMGKPALFDMRQVDVSRITASDIIRHMMKKSTLDESIRTAFVAYLVQGLPAQALVRMANTYAELMGLTSEDRGCITEDYNAAVRCLAEVVSLSDAETVALRERLLPRVLELFPHGTA
ncbi:MAG: hypothetical protein GYB25_02690 [Rhodobacteraceae bacterium]|nr:hypothetical protein [Paracoccaceae bacterium]